MDEPIIYCPWASPELIEPAESLYDELTNALKLDDKDEFLRLLKDQPMQHSKMLFISEFNVTRMLREDTPQIAMAVLNGETGGIIEDEDNQLVFKDGWTPLHLAAATPYSPKLIKCLIERGDPVDVPCDYYAPLNLKQPTPLDLALEVIDTGYVYGSYTTKRPWTLRSSIFELFHYVCQLRQSSLEVIRLLVQNTQNKERVRKAFINSANEGKFVKVAALFLAAPELFLSKSEGGGSVSSIDELYLNLNYLDKTTDIQDGLSLLLDVFDLVGHMLIAYLRLDDPKVWNLSFYMGNKIGFFLREAAHKKLGILSRDDYLLSLFKPLSLHAVEPSCIPPPPPNKVPYSRNLWFILPFEMKRKDINIDYVNRMIPSLAPHEAGDLRKAIDVKLSTMPNICTLSEGTTRMPNQGGTQWFSFPHPRSIELPIGTKAANLPLDFKHIPRFDRENRVMNPTKLKSFFRAVRLSRFAMIAKRLMK